MAVYINECSKDILKDDTGVCWSMNDYSGTQTNKQSHSYT